ncbi:unnamed protein product, partial [Thlaspi arvense]
GTENLLGIYFNTLEINEPLVIDENSFRGMLNLKFLKFCKEWWSRKTGEGRLYLSGDFVRFPRELRLLHWDEYPSKCMPCNFRGEYLVELNMIGSKLEKLWEGAQVLSPPPSSFHGVDGASLSLSLSSFNTCLGGEPLYCDPMIIQQQDTWTPSETASLYFDPMIVEQQDTETASEGPSLSLQLVNYFSYTLFVYTESARVKKAK